MCRFKAEQLDIPFGLFIYGLLRLCTHKTKDLSLPLGILFHCPCCFSLEYSLQLAWRGKKWHTDQSCYFSPAAFTTCPAYTMLNIISPAVRTELAIKWFLPCWISSFSVGSVLLHNKRLNIFWQKLFWRDMFNASVIEQHIWFQCVLVNVH